MKFLLTIIGIMVALAGFVWGATRFLAIDDLADCPERPTSTGECRAADAIVAISGGDTGARVAEAVSLYKAGWAPKLVFSGAALDTSGPSNAEAMSAQAVKLGVPKKHIVTEEYSNDTAANAEFIADIAKQEDLKRLLLVTSPYHQRRASMEFRRVFGDQAVVINHSTQSDRLWSRNAWWVTPGGWWLTLNELGKIIYINTVERSP